ncbi:MAG TPA: glycosyltransferase N-terminal domain-containing protein, partial [Chlamydiales bacterium]|nr:glycosyltransferase N-terminal domain-containing protein [Chlamydiales bacterium]
MIFSLFYEIACFFTFLAFLPKIAYKAVTKGKYRKNFWKRLGFGFPDIPRDDSSPLFWIHAGSVGETQAISALVKQLKNEVPNARFVISSITETGHETAKRIMPFATAHVYLPFDFFFTVRKVLSKARPDVVILAESDFWWRFLYEAKRKGAVILLASGKISPRSYERFKRFSFFSRKLFSLVDHYCVQDTTYQSRFLDLGVPASKMAVTGNIKGDVTFSALSPEEKAEIYKKFNLSEKDFLLVVGSTHAPEEEVILSALKPLLENNPRFKLMIVPRHPERFSEVKAICEKTNIAFATWTEPTLHQYPKIIVVD